MSISVHELSDISQMTYFESNFSRSKIYNFHIKIDMHHPYDDSVETKVVAIFKKRFTLFYFAENKRFKLL